MWARKSYKAVIAGQVALVGDFAEGFVLHHAKTALVSLRARLMLGEQVGWLVSKRTVAERWFSAQGAGRSFAALAASL